MAMKIKKIIIGGVLIVIGVPMLSVLIAVVSF
jgi:hypothetical protein